MSDGLYSLVYEMFSNGFSLKSVVSICKDAFNNYRENEKMKWRDR